MSGCAWRNRPDVTGRKWKQVSNMLALISPLGLAASGACVLAWLTCLRNTYVPAIRCAGARGWNQQMHGPNLPARFDTRQAALERERSLKPPVPDHAQQASGYSG